MVVGRAWVLLIAQELIESGAVAQSKRQLQIQLSGWVGVGHRMQIGGFERMVAGKGYRRPHHSLGARNPGQKSR